MNIGCSRSFVTSLEHGSNSSPSRGRIEALYGHNEQDAADVELDQALAKDTRL